MRLCAITDRKRLAQASEGEEALALRLRNLALGWIAGGVDFIQLREKDLSPAKLGRLVRSILHGVERRRTKLLVNLPADIDAIREIAPVADGVHFPGRPAPGIAEPARGLFQAAGGQGLVSFSCHTFEDLRVAKAEGADFVLFAPVFEKAELDEARSAGIAGLGLEALQRACEAAGEMPVFALGGVNEENAAACVAAGAAGVAGIRVFTQPGWQRLRATDI
jgi:thiamine-phosphate pyrophosphorylase